MRQSCPRCSSTLISMTLLLLCFLFQAVHSPLQQRSSILDLDYRRANQLPVDYDTDLELVWADPRLMGSDSERNIYYQRELATKINEQVREMLALLTKTSLLHLSLGQSLLINTTSVIYSLKSLSNQVIKQFGQAWISFPANFTLLTNETRSISLRVRLDS